MIDHQGQTSILAIEAWVPIYVSAVVSYSLSYDANDIMDKDNLVIALSAQTQIIIPMIDMVRKPSTEPND